MNRWNSILIDKEQCKSNMHQTEGKMWDFRQKVSQEPWRYEEYLNRHWKVGQFTNKSSSTSVHTFIVYRLIRKNQVNIPVNWEGLLVFSTTCWKGGSKLLLSPSSEYIPKSLTGSNNIECQKILMVLPCQIIFLLFRSVRCYLRWQGQIRKRSNITDKCSL